MPGHQGTEKRLPAHDHRARGAAPRPVIGFEFAPPLKEQVAYCV